MRRTLDTRGMQQEYDDQFGETYRSPVGKSILGQHRGAEAKRMCLDNYFSLTNPTYCWNVSRTLSQLRRCGASLCANPAEKLFFRLSEETDSRPWELEPLFLQQ